MNSQLEHTCESCGDDVEPLEDAGDGDHHFHEDCQALIKRRSRDQRRREIMMRQS